MANRLEQYLDEVAQPVSDCHRMEWREEARQHIASLVAAHEELGLGHEEAVEAALASFGEARQIGQSVQKETTRASSIRALGRGVLYFALPVFACFFPMAVATALFGLVGGETYLSSLRTAGSLLLVFAPILGGWNVGRKASPSRPLRDVLFTATLGALLCAPYSMIFSLFRNPSLRPAVGDAALSLLLALAATCLSYVWQTRRTHHRVVV
jgi:hypothetical protein